jgi:hypothetical protein
MGEAIADRPLSEPHRDRLSTDTPDFAEIVAAHELAMSRGESGYTDPRSGLFVLAATYLVSRGHCCDSGCRHCPYVV